MVQAEMLVPLHSPPPPQVNHPGCLGCMCFTEGQPCARAYLPGHWGGRDLSAHLVLEACCQALPHNTDTGSWTLPMPVGC